MQNFSLLIKPTSADCNLKCSYCFYLKKKSLYPNKKQHRMSDKTLDNMVSSFLKTKQQNYAFGWQGGEPTMMGLEFFEKVIEFQKYYGRSGLNVSNGLQTNAVLIDNKMAAHFAKYNYLLGVSLDGPAQYHDKYRLNLANEGSHKDIINSIGILKQNNVEFNILSMINSTTASHAKEIYNYMTNADFNFLQFIPCVEFDMNNKPLPFTVSGPAFGEFLCNLFDVWYENDTRKVSIRLFDSILHLLVDNVRNVCHFGKDCRQYLVVEHNGDIYPCDFFVLPSLKLGNLNVDSWDKLLSSPKYRNFGLKKSEYSAKCAKCKFINICAGECLKHRLYGKITDPKNVSWLCEGWEMFFEHTLDRFTKLATTIIKERKEQEELYRQQATQQAPQVAGRNGPCPCGSGKKYKNCCMV